MSLYNKSSSIQLMERLSIKYKGISFTFFCCNSNLSFFLSFNLLFGTMAYSHWSNYFTKMDDVDFHSTLSYTFIFCTSYTNTECVDKVRYLPYGKSFTFSTFRRSTFSVHLSNHDICQIFY